MATAWDRVRQIFFSVIFLSFCSYAVWEFFNYNPKPYDLEKALSYWKAANVDIASLKTGDLVLRLGKGFVSESCRQFNQKEKKYSHSGIIKREGRVLYVYNSIGGEAREINVMKKERLELFCHPDVAFGFAIYRYDLDSSEVTAFDSIIGHWYESGMEFDLDFDMATDETMYCSEMIYKALEIVKGGENYLPLSLVNDKPYVAIDDLYFHSNCTQLFEYNYD